MIQSFRNCVSVRKAGTCSFDDKIKVNKYYDNTGEKKFTAALITTPFRIGIESCLHQFLLVIKLTAF